MLSNSALNRRFAQSVAETLRHAGYQALFAGGCVRDILLRRTPKDFDVATDAKPEHVRSLFGQHRTLPVGASFGVIVVIPTKSERDNGINPVEVATFRTEGPYLDGRRPSEVMFATAEEDAKRRDFTINGMFIDPISETVLDFVGGRTDLSARVVRAIGDPRERMTEDKLRLLRAIRFTATLDFRLDEATARAVEEMASQLIVVSAERISQELRRMLTDGHRRKAVELCERGRLLEVMFPELTAVIHNRNDWETTLDALGALDQPSFELALTVLLQGVAVREGTSAVDDICRRLKLSNAERERVIWLLSHQADLQDIENRPLWFLKRLGANDAASELVALVASITATRRENNTSVRFFQRFLAETPHEELNPAPLISGDELIRLGYRPGPRFKEVLEEIRNQQLDGKISGQNEALEVARQLHENAAADTNGPP